jgi:D-alanyl-D-alanine carboxypeptidase (penicillin-binding protein 5/6)
MPVHGDDDQTGSLTISASACVLIDTDSGTRLYEKNSTSQLANAGMGRLVNVLVSLDSDQDRVTFNANGHTYATSAGLTDGNTYDVEDLRYAALIGNDEDAADALSCLYDDTLDRMNAKASDIGMTGTTYTNTYGHEDGELSTAYDIAMLVREYARDETLQTYYKATSYTPSSFDDNTAITRDLMTYDGLVGEFETASDQAKTVAAASAERDGTRLTAVVVGAADIDTARRELTLLLNYGFDNFQSYTISKDEIGYQTVVLDQDKTRYSITFSLGTDINVLMSNSIDPEELSTDVVYENEDDPDLIEAYVVVQQNGTEVGRMKMEKDVQTETLKTAPKVSVFDGICMALAVLFLTLFALKHLTILIKPKE